jgi:hypothetical protein
VTTVDLPLSPTLNADEAAWAAREARFGMGAVLASMPAWLNHPAHIARAEYKPVQDVERLEAESIGVTARLF